MAREARHRPTGVLLLLACGSVAGAGASGCASEGDGAPAPTSGEGAASVAPASEAEPAPRELGDPEETMTESSATGRVTVDVDGTGLSAIDVGPRREEAVLLLHGARFSAETWQDLGTLQRLVSDGTRAIALDLPGYGASPAAPSIPPARVLEGVLDALGVRRAVVVAPSMGGCFLAPFAARHAERLAGVVPVAPACADDFVGPSDVPARIVWGGADRVFPVEGAGRLAERFPGAEVEVFPGADHPCYLDEPERFHRLLTDFVERVLGR